MALHDAEIQRLKQHYEDHKELFEGIQKWEESWRLYLELEVGLEKESQCFIRSYWFAFLIVENSLEMTDI